MNLIYSTLTWQGFLLSVCLGLFPCDRKKASLGCYLSQPISWEYISQTLSVKKLLLGQIADRKLLKGQHFLNGVVFSRSIEVIPSSILESCTFMFLILTKAAVQRSQSWPQSATIAVLALTLGLGASRVVLCFHETWDYSFSNNNHSRQFTSSHLCLDSHGGHLPALFCSCRKSADLSGNPAYESCWYCLSTQKESDGTQV